MAQTIDIVAVLMDGSTPSANDSQLEQSPFPIVLQQGIDAILRFTVRRQSQALVDLTGCTITFGWARDPVDSASGIGALLQRDAIPQSPFANGIAHGIIVPNDTLNMGINDRFSWCAWIKLPDNTRQPIVPLSQITMSGSAVVPGTPVTVPVIAPPLYPQLSSLLLTFPAGVGGAPDILPILDAANAAAYDLQIVKIETHCDVGLPGETINLQVGPTVPGLVAITEDFDFSNFQDGWQDETAPVFTREISTGNLLYISRSNNTIAGSVLVTVRQA